MAVKDGNTRISLVLSKELDEKIDKLARLQNLSKNSTILNLVDISIDMQIQIWNMMKDPQMMNQLMDMVTKPMDK